jgi:hypothetical protein
MEQIDNLRHIHTTKQVYIQHVNPTKQFNNQLNMQFFNLKISARIQSANILIYKRLNLRYEFTL